MPPTHSRCGDVESVLRRRPVLPGRRVTRRACQSWWDDSGSGAADSKALIGVNQNHEISTVTVEISW